MSDCALARLLSREISTANMLEIKILGIPESQRTAELIARVNKALAELNQEAEVKFISDLQDLIAFDLSGIPALVLGNELLFQKDIPEVEELVQAIQKYIKTE